MPGRIEQPGAGRCGGDAAAVRVPAARSWGGPSRPIPPAEHVDQFRLLVEPRGVLHERLTRVTCGSWRSFRVVLPLRARWRSLRRQEQGQAPVGVGAHGPELEAFPGASAVPDALVGKEGAARSSGCGAIRGGDNARICRRPTSIRRQALCRRPVRRRGERPVAHRPRGSWGTAEASGRPGRIIPESGSGWPRYPAVSMVAEVVGGPLCNLGSAAATSEDDAAKPWGASATHRVTAEKPPRTADLGRPGRICDRKAGHRDTESG